MVLMVGAHMAQTFLVRLLQISARDELDDRCPPCSAFTLVMGFTGQLLRWDQTAAWSVVVAAEQAGRVPLIGDWLARFILGGTRSVAQRSAAFSPSMFSSCPALMFVFIGLHLMAGVASRHLRAADCRQASRSSNLSSRIRRTCCDKSGHPFWPDGAWRDFVVGTGLIIAIAFACIFCRAAKARTSHLIRAFSTPIRGLTGIYFGISHCSR